MSSAQQTPGSGKSFDRTALEVMRQYCYRLVAFVVAAAVIGGVFVRPTGNLWADATMWSGSALFGVMIFVGFVADARFRAAKSE